MNKTKWTWVIAKLRKWGVPENYVYAVEEMDEAIASAQPQRSESIEFVDTGGAGWEVYENGKPASGATSSEPQEWTPEYVKALIHESPAFKDIYKRLSDAHNAALANEREKLDKFYIAARMADKI